MNNFIIINLQAIAGTLAIIVGFRIWVLPRIAKASIYEALLPLVYLNAFRYTGLYFMTQGQMYDGFPNEFVTTVGLLDYTTALLAILAVIALKGKWKSAIALVWLFNIIGFGDLATAFPQFFLLEMYNYDLGNIWTIFVIYGLAAFLSHIYIFVRLVTNRRTAKA